MPEDKELEAEVQRHRNLIDDYEQSVRGLYAFASSACWDEALESIRPESEISIPRTMTPLRKEKDEAEKDGGDKPEAQAAPPNVTPDGVIQITEDYGVVAEMRKHFREGDHEKYDQIKKYDQNLAGWWTSDKLIPVHDLVLLTHTFSSVDAKDAYEYWKKLDNSFDRKFAIVEFSHSQQGQNWFLLRRVEGGELSDPIHDEALRRGKKIADQYLILLTSKYKFYDDDPPQKKPV